MSCGLNAFEEAGVTPHVIDSGEINGDAFLILSYLDEERPVVNEN